MNQDRMQNKRAFLGQFFSVFFSSRKAALITSLFSIAVAALLYTAYLQVNVAEQIELPTGQAVRTMSKSSTAPLTTPREILILDSYHVGHTWSDNEMAGIIDIVRETSPDIRYYIEYLDCKRHPKHEQFEQLKELFKLKYGNRDIPVVIAADNPALEFALKYRSLLFPHSAIVFCGVNNFKKEMLEGEANITGLAEALNAVDTMRLALKLHPKTREVVIVHDYTSTGLATRREAEEQMKGLFGTVSFRNLEDLTKNELTRVLKGLPEDSLVLALAYNVFKDGEVIGHEDLARLLSANAPVPVYGVHQERLGYGIMGGSLLSGKLHGTAAGRVVLRILSGTPASNIPVEMKPPTRVMFDYNQLVRFGIPMNALPEGSVVVNRPIPFIATHLYLVVSTLLVIIILTSGIIILGFNMYRRELVEDALRTSKEELEIQVSNRTAELQNANERLNVELIERKTAQEALLRSEERLREAQRISMVGNWELDLEDNFLLWSDEIYRIFEIDPSKFCASYEAFLERIHPDDRDKVNAAYTESVRSRIPYTIEHRLLFPDGRIKYVHEQCETYYDSDGRPLRSIGTVQNITDLKRAEEEIRELNASLGKRVSKRTLELEESQHALMNIVEDLNLKTAELEDANAKLLDLDRLKSMFIASMSHELRTPLNSIIGFSSIIRDEWIGPVNPEQKENLDTIKRSGKHLLSLINDVIDVSKIEAGKIEARFEEFDLYDLLTEAVQYVEKDVCGKGLELHLDIHHHPLCSDRRRLLQSVINLLSNAVKFTEHGEITVSSAVADIGRGPGERHPAGTASPLIDISIGDSGIGIAKEDIPRLFQAFERLESPLRTTAPGTGLGLYLTRKLVVEVLGGDILCKSEPGMGSTFTLRIPERKDEKSTGSRG